MPSSLIFLAVFGANPSKDFIAVEVCERAFNSRTWPNKVSEIIAAVASKYTATRPIEMKDAGKTCGATVPTTL